ncbi:MAG TPA: NADH-quinone oxidoreductase subunit H [Candidatus Polarisedimenticolaceae bacterium]|nr:NADH-quinone oxidoreductase subunit H [Candidatus Polarisedimenticolaceae bacterium]
MNPASLLHLPAALVLAPLLGGLAQRTKAWFAGRRGAPLLQPYRDLLKLARKGAVYSPTTTWVFRAVPVVGVAAASAALLLLPLGALPAPLGFPGDLLLLAGLLAAGRFASVVGALDTGSSFSGMGASREVAFAALGEPTLLLALAALARATGSTSLSGMLGALDVGVWLQAGPALVLVALTLFAVLLADAARIPVDDPATHLELTMIHEVMVLDHSGPDLAAIQYAGALRLWILGALLVGVALPLRSGNAALDAAVQLAGLALVGILIGIVESSMARLRLVRVPQFLVGAAALAVLALMLSAGANR